MDGMSTAILLALTGQLVFNRDLVSPSNLSCQNARAPFFSRHLSGQAQTECVMVMGGINQANIDVGDKGKQIV